VSDGSSGQRTQPASPKRIREFRQRGEIATSRDLVAIATFGAGAVAMVALAGVSGAALTSLTERAARSADGAVGAELAPAAAWSFVRAVSPALIGALAGCVLAGLAQIGWPPALRKPSFDLSRLLPGGALAEALSLKAAGRRLFTAVGKLAAVGAVVTAVLVAELDRGLTVVDASQLGQRLFTAAVRIGIAAVMALGALAAIDFVLAKRRMSAKMKMTPDEIKREHKESEGDPMVKGKRRARMRQLAKRRMASEVKAADVVVVNPTHYAVALRYRADSDAAPRVVAKGADEVAEHIRALARQAGVPILSRPPLARALFKVAEGGQVPAPLYKAVAEVLAYVYRLRPGLARAATAAAGATTPDRRPRP
jgi:flagellar biosynthetic protein FlhB